MIVVSPSCPCTRPTEKHWLLWQPWTELQECHQQRDPYDRNQQPGLHRFPATKDRAVTKLWTSTLYLLLKRATLNLSHTLDFLRKAYKHWHTWIKDCYPLQCSGTQTKMLLSLQQHERELCQAVESIETPLAFFICLSNYTLKIKEVQNTTSTCLTTP